MSLRTRLAAIVVAILLGLAMLHAVIFVQVVQPGFDRLEQAEADRDLRRVREAVQREIEDIDLLAGDWADSNDTYTFVRDRNGAYRTSRLGPTLFSQIRIHLLVLLDRQGGTVWSGLVDPDNGDPLSLPLFSDTGLASDHPLLRVDGHADPLSGLLSTPRGPLLLSVRPIRYSDRSGPSAGTLLMGRFLSSAMLADLSGLTQLPLSATSIDALRADHADLADRLDSERPTAVESLPDGGLRGHVLVPDLFGRPAVVLQATLPHDLLAHARGTLQWMLAAAGLGGVLLLGGLLAMNGALVVQPLGRLTRHVAALYETGDLSARLGPQESAEMTGLAASLDRLAERMEQTATERDRTQSQLLDGIHGIVDGLALWDADDRLVLCNDRYPACIPQVADLIAPGVAFVEIATAGVERGQLSPGDASCPEWVAVRLEQHRHPQGPQEYPLADGRWLEIREHRTQDGGVVGIYTDITRRKRAEEQLRDMVQELERSNTDLEQFAYVASHDLQEPLRQIGSYAQLLERRFADKLDDDGREFIRYMVDGARRMQEQVTDLLAYASINRQERPHVAVDSGDAVRTALAQLRTTIASAGAQVQVGQLPAVKGDRTLIIQLFQNLIGNAVKYARRDVAPQITISAERLGGDWQFAVADNGIGFDPAEADRIFGIFQRLHSRDEYQGTGIGLAICKRIVERHQGDIRAESLVGQGSTFLFTLPAAPSQAEPPVSAEISA